MINKKVMVSFLTIILLLSLGMYFYFLSNSKEASDISKERDSQQEKNVVTNPYTIKERDSQQEKNEDVRPYTAKENKYYIVYIKHDNGSASSFIPLKLNPDFKNDLGFHVSISIDDYGNIINDDKIIVIDNFSISKNNKKMIREIAGIENYEEALKEIEERLIETRKNLEKDGLL